MFFVCFLFLFCFVLFFALSGISIVLSIILTIKLPAKKGTLKMSPEKYFSSLPVFTPCCKSGFAGITEKPIVFNAESMEGVPFDKD